MPVATRHSNGVRRGHPRHGFHCGVVRPDVQGGSHRTTAPHGAIIHLDKFQSPSMESSPHPGLAGSGRTPPVKGVGEPCAGEPYARFAGRGLETERTSVTAPTPDPTDLFVAGSSGSRSIAATNRIEAVSTTATRLWLVRADALRIRGDQTAHPGAYRELGTQGESRTNSLSPAPLRRNGLSRQSREPVP